MLRLISAAVAAALLLAPQYASAQQQQATATPAAPPSYGAPITLDLAKKAVAAAEAEATKNGWSMAIAVVDSGSKLVAFARMDNTQLGSIDIAMGKATTSNNLKRPTKALQDGVAQGGVNLRLIGQPGITPLEGAVPILIDGKIVGAIGVSGALSSQDAQCAMAGAAAAAAK
jgi:glc operon protein GlcG